MRRKSGGVGKKNQPDAIDEVEELLKLTEDDLLLNLTVNSHIKSKSKSQSNSKFDLLPESSHTNAIDPDLDRRLQALRAKPSKSIPKEAITADHEDFDNLLARFAALKAPSKATSTSNSTQGNAVKDDILGIVDDEDEEDEVSKIINWAIDAARLDPSPSSDIDEDDDSDGDSDDDAKKKTSKKIVPHK
ncbi:uncharacterized protein LOC111893948 [Lactuca sativa]|uniref:Uncharacterized protein n=1 Tax=Lactuca sativa TaxID=4236 RepID=A0A9R1X4U0_LACSA|nr:uncharacterized protein LOC111893948 [Lactuca sativa]KAJ0200785.1 hypothetical protein LSAT_V11C600323670 [Lactuca sativa]